MSDFKIDTSTRCAEGFYNSIRFIIAHGMLYAPFFAKERSLELGTSFIREYGRHSLRALAVYTVGFSYMYGSR